VPASRTRPAGAAASAADLRTACILRITRPPRRRASPSLSVDRGRAWGVRSR